VTTFPYPANPGSASWYTLGAGNTANTVANMWFYPLTYTVTTYWHTKCRKKAKVLLYCMVPYPEKPVKCHGCGKVIARRKAKATGTDA